MEGLSGKIVEVWSLLQIRFDGEWLVLPTVVPSKLCVSSFLGTEKENDDTSSRILRSLSF